MKKGAAKGIYNAVKSVKRGLAAKAREEPRRREEVEKVRG